MPENRANAVCKDSEIFDKLSRKCDKKDIIQKKSGVYFVIGKRISTFASHYKYHATNVRYKPIIIKTKK